MPLIRRQWSAAAADEWRKEDWIAIVLSTIAYLALTIGSALSFMLLTSGFIILAGGIIVTVLMYWVIDPKLRAISRQYEKRQKDYLRDLEAIQQWEQSDE